MAVEVPPTKSVDVITYRCHNFSQTTIMTMVKWVPAVLRVLPHPDTSGAGYARVRNPHLSHHTYRYLNSTPTADLEIPLGYENYTPLEPLYLGQWWEINWILSRSVMTAIYVTKLGKQWNTIRWLKEVHGLWLIFTWTKWPRFRRRCIQMHFRDRKVLYFD